MPPPAREPSELLAHLRYIALRKSLDHIQAVTPAELTGFYGNAWWFHNHAGQIDLVLTQDEIKAFGVEDVERRGYLASGVSKARLNAALKGDPLLFPEELKGPDPTKLDNLPGNKDPGQREDYLAASGPLLRGLFDSGFYRLLKGIPRDLWDEVEVIEIRKMSGNDLDRLVILGFRGNPILEMTARRKADLTYVLIYFHYLVYPKRLYSLSSTPTP